MYQTIAIFQKTEAALHSCSYKMMFLKYVANFLKNTHAEMGVLL